jgi:hypothetical protein
MAFPIAELWSKEIQRNLDNNLVFKNLCNTMYQGDVQQNGIVRVPSVGDITISDYIPNGATTRETPEPTTQTMTIDKMKYFDFSVDDVHAAQISLPLMQKYSERAAYGMSNAIDTALYAHRADVAAANIIGTDAAPIALTKTNIISYIIMLEVKLNIAKASSVGRWLSVSSEVAAVLKEVAFDKTNYTTDPNALATGYIGKVGGFNIYESAAVRPITSVHNILGGSGDFINFVDQIQKVETYRPESGFSNAVKGLYVYGSKVFRGTEGVLLKASVA